MRARQNSRTGPPCPYGEVADPSELALLPQTALSVFVPLTYRAPAQLKTTQKKQWGGMLRKASKLLNSGPPAVPSGPYIFSVQPTTPLPKTFHRLNPIPAEPDNPYGIAYPSHTEQSAAVYPRPDYTARIPSTASASTAVHQHTDQLVDDPRSESQRVAGATTRSAFTGGVTGLTGFTGITGFTDYTQTTTLDGRITHDYHSVSSTAPTATRSAQGETGWNDASRSAGVVSRSTVAHTTSFSREQNSNHVYVPPMASAASYPGHGADGSNGIENPPALTHATSAPTPESMDLGIGPNLRATIAADSRKTQEHGRLTIPEDPPWSGLSADGTGDHIPRTCHKGASLDKNLSNQLKEMTQQAAAASSEKRERIDAVVQAIENVQSFGMDQQLLRQYHMPPGAPIHRGQNSCSMCIMSALNGHKYAIKHYGSDAVLAEEQELFMRTHVHMVCPQVRHLDAKNHRHLLQSAVCITPALRPLDKYIKQNRSAFSRRSAQVHLLTRLTTILDLLHEHGKRIHGNLTAHHVLVDTHQSPHSFTIVDFSCSRPLGDSSYAPWGLYDVAFAAPEVIAATLSAPQAPDPELEVVGKTEGVSAASDLWSLGMLLFNAATDSPYWPRSYSEIDMVQCLLGHTSLPHETTPGMLDAAGALFPIISRLLSRSPEIRPSVLDVGEFAAHGVCEAVMGLTSTDGAMNKFFTVNRQQLTQEVPHMPPDADTLLALQRNQLHAAHRLVCGQELCVIFQVWQPVPGHVTQRQLCPVVMYGGAQNKASFTEQLDTVAASKMEPVFQFVAGQKYYLSFLIQNRDPTSLRKLPFTDCVEMRLGVGSEGDMVHEKPRIRQSNSGLWWGEMPWSPATYQHDLCQDPSLTSEEEPGLATVALLLAVPFMGSPLRVKRSLHFNMNPAGTVLASNPLKSAHVDIHQHPDAARREIIKHGLTSTVCLGSTAAMMVHDRLR